jgi:PEGA domain-containing protein
VARSVLVTVVVLASIVASAGRARADERDDARREFAAGQAADQRRDWQTAIEHYLRANDLVPHPFAIFNIATDYERLGKLREAATWYERYLTAAPDSPDRERVAATLREIAVRPAKMTVRSIPSGATVKIDNVPVGVTPLIGSIPGGFHRISVDKDGQIQTKDVTVEFAEPVAASFTLRGAAGLLSVRGQPPGALVSIDDLAAGTLPVTVNLPPGEHTVKVTAYGFTPFETRATVVPNAEVPVDVTLVRALGTIDTQKPDAEQYQAGYLFGIGGGVNLSGEGSLYLVDIGFRYKTIDGALRTGSGGGVRLIDVIGRFAFWNAKLAPYLGLGYTFAAGADDSSSSSMPAVSGGGVLLAGGLRYDVSRGPIGVSLIAETGIRYFLNEKTTFVPVMASVQLVYGSTTR